MTQENPFTYGRPILDPGRFFGRHQEVHQIFNRLSIAQSVSVVGERRIGKTSLLKYISHPDVRREHGLGLAESAFVFVDFQGLSSGTTSADFWAEVLKDVGSQIEDATLQGGIEQAIAEGRLGTQEVGTLLDRVTGHGCQVVLLLDELEDTIQKPHLGRDFYNGLRFLAGLHGLSLITASNRELAELGFTEESVGSSFFNIFSVMLLSPFTREEAQGLIDKSLAVANASFAFEPEEKELAFSLSGCYPCFLQMACCFLFEAHLHGHLLEERLNLAEKQLAGQMASHFDYYWQQSTTEEKKTLQTLAILPPQRGQRIQPFFEGLQSPKTVSKQAVLSLQRRNLMIVEDGKYQLFSALFGAWIKENVDEDLTASSPKKLLSQEWLKERASGVLDEIIASIVLSASAYVVGVVTGWLPQSPLVYVVTSVIVIVLLLGLYVNWQQRSR